MGGAYTAKPDAAPSVPDVPDGWDIDWPFPGPHPPGYDPDYSFTITSPAILKYNIAAPVTIELFDHDTYATREPNNPITWTATVNGEAVDLRIEGVGDYASSVTSDFSESDDFWSSSPSLEFQLTEDNNGDVLTLTATSTIYDDVVTENVDIVITENDVYTAVITFSVSYDDYTQAFIGTASATGSVYYDYPFRNVGFGRTEVDNVVGAWYNYDNAGLIELDVLTSNSGRISISNYYWALLENEIFTLRIYRRLIGGGEVNNVSMSATVIVYQNGSQIDTDTKSLGPLDDPSNDASETENWFQVNSTSITIL